MNKLIKSLLLLLFLWSWFNLTINDFLSKLSGVITIWLAVDAWCPKKAGKVKTQKEALDWTGRRGWRPLFSLYITLCQTFYNVFKKTSLKCDLIYLCEIMIVSEEIIMKVILKISLLLLTLYGLQNPTVWTYLGWVSIVVTIWIGIDQISTKKKPQKKERNARTSRRQLHKRR